MSLISVSPCPKCGDADNYKIVSRVVSSQGAEIITVPEIICGKCGFSDYSDKTD